MRLVTVAAAMLLAGCSVQGQWPEDPARELAAVPFFPQTLHQCGPAALATVLGWSGVAVTPEELAPQVYIPGRRGSLALELAAATRRAGRVAYRLPADAAAIDAELAAGTPVLVLQDLGVAWINAWHFAVVVGTNGTDGAYVLRSGTERRRIESRRRFLDSWARGGRWALVALPPGRLPASLAPAAVAGAIEDARAFLPPGATTATYAALVKHWPGEATAWFAAGNDAYGAGRLEAAEEAYRRLLDIEPGHVAGRNNLANALLDRGCPRAAAAEAQRAWADLERDPASQDRFRDAVAETRQRALAAAGPASGC